MTSNFLFEYKFSEFVYIYIFFFFEIIENIWNLSIVTFYSFCSLDYIQVYNKGSFNSLINKTNVCFAFELFISFLAIETSKIKSGLIKYSVITRTHEK